MDSSQSSEWLQLIDGNPTDMHDSSISTSSDSHTSGNVNYEMIVFDQELHDQSNADSLEDEQDDQQSQIMNEQIKKKTRKQNGKRKSSKSSNPYYCHSLRVLKSDIRRQYTAMYFNVLNSYDSELMHSYFQEFFHPNCEWIVNFPEFVYPNRMFSKGPENIIQSFLDMYTRMPDFIMHASDVSVRVTYNESESRIVGTVRVHGTMMYDIVNAKSLPYNAPRFPRILKNDEKDQENENSTISILHDSELTCPVVLKKLDDVSLMNMIGVFSFTLDGAKRIIRVQTDMYEMKEETVQSH